MAGYAVIAISFVLVINALVGENGYLDTLRANREYAELSDSLRRVRAENDQLREETCARVKIRPRSKTRRAANCGWPNPERP
jgi:hypothetical protein